MKEDWLHASPTVRLHGLMKSPVFHILDPGMTAHLGHHREINMAIARGLQARGYQVRVWVHRAYPVSPAEKSTAGIEVVPWFSVNPYAIYSAQGPNELIDWHGQAEWAFLKEIDELNLLGDVHLSNLFPYQFLGLSKLKNIKLSACVHHHPCRYTEHGEILWVQAWAKTRAQLHEMRLLTVEQNMANEIDRCTDTKGGVVVAPFPLSEKVQMTSKPHHKCIGLLGGMRREQGLKYLEQTIDTINSFGYDALLHDVKGAFSGKFDSKKVVRVGYSDQFNEVLALCDAVLLNYDPVAYRFMGSGIAWEAAANGIPFLYSRGTAMSTMARHYGLGLSFAFANQNSIKNAMAMYIDQRETIHKNARTMAKNIRSEHGLSMHLDQLLNA
jgi:hypothetical protein